MTVKKIVEHKGSNVITLPMGRTVNHAIEILIRHNIGALVVVDEKNKPVGIISERDILREIHNRGDAIHETPVERVMSSELIVGVLEDTLDYVRCTFTKNRIRHLPIIEGGNLVGIVSIGDVVKALIKEKDTENKYLRDFIMDKYPG
ncbi:CBS domain-containing protein [candidate division CSSED10-310 bacterium]|uniref:CBS domain-containing protein n=1 Tax=candidate division CSSED10-310 bacterium TaxID=2855610 RepID=A0ABV6Z0Q0_UNCC1